MHLAGHRNHPKIGLTVYELRSSLCATSANIWQLTPTRHALFKRGIVLRGNLAEVPSNISLVPGAASNPYALTEVRRTLD
jgi:hypothetical protein